MIFARPAGGPARALHKDHAVLAEIEAVPLPRPEDDELSQASDLRRLLTLAVVVVVIAALYVGRTVMLPITLAVLLSFVLAPLVGLLRRLYLGRVLSVLVAVLLALGVIGALAGLIGVQIAGLAEEIPRYAFAIERKVEATREVTLDRLTDLLARAGKFMQPVVPRHAPQTPGAPAASAAVDATPIPVEVHQPSPTAMEVARNVFAPVIDPLSTAAIVFIVTIFILLQREDLRDRFIRLFGSGDLHRTTAAINDAVHRLSRYFRSLLAVNVGFGLVIGGGLFMIGVPSPTLWGTLAMLLRFVPYIGAPLAAVLPLGLAAAADSGWSLLLMTGGLFVVTEVVVAHVVEPMIYGRGTGLSPFSVVVAATFWMWLWGPIGLILATPLTLCFVVLGRHVARFAFLDVLLGDRPALTPSESFYQRMLAGDPDEAHSQAEQFLRDEALCAYYDDVALPGLRMAAADVVRGVLTAVQMARIQSSILSLIEELEDHRPREPQAAANDAPADRAATHGQDPDVDQPMAESAPPPVVCVAGRGPLDVAAAAMLAQLLRQEGIGVRLEPYAATTRAAIGSFDMAGVTMICLCHLELAGTPSHARYTLRRLRQRGPAATLVSGLWKSDDPILQDESLRATTVADHFVTSLHDAVTICLKTTKTAAR